MKQLFQDLAIVLAWICCILLFSWLLLYFTSEIRSTSLIRLCNTEIKGQGSTVSVQKILSMNNGGLLFSASKPNATALLSPMLSPYGLSMNLMFIDASLHADTLYPIGMSSHWINQRTNPELVSFFMDLWITNPVLKEKRSK